MIYVPVPVPAPVPVCVFRPRTRGITKRPCSMLETKTGSQFSYDISAGGSAWPMATSISRNHGGAQGCSEAVRYVSSHTVQHTSTRRPGAGLGEAAPPLGGDA